MALGQLKWKDVVREELIALGGQGHLKEINEKIAGHPKCATNPTWQDTIRRVVRQYKIFEPVPPSRSGVYRLVDEAAIAIGRQTVEGSADTQHGTIQGMLTGLGRSYGYETFVPRRDQTSRVFQGGPLGDYVAVRDLAEVFRGRNVATIREIDAMWLDEDEEGMFPVYAFEVEHTTKVKSGLDRLVKIPRRFATELFIIGPSAEERRLFDEYTGREPFRTFSVRFRFRLYKEVESLYGAAVDHAQRRDNFGVEERWRRQHGHRHGDGSR